VITSERQELIFLVLSFPAGYALLKKVFANIFEAIQAHDLMTPFYVANKQKQLVFI
jgi:hypothetical protein